MSKKPYCSVPALWNLDEFGRHRCDDSSHQHFSRSQVARYELEGRVRWLRRADAEGNGGVLRLTAAPVGHALDRVTIRDASCYFGGYVVIAAARGELWARTMIANIVLRVRESERFEECIANVR